MLSKLTVPLCSSTCSSLWFAGVIEKDKDFVTIIILQSVRIQCKSSNTTQKQFLKYYVKVMLLIITNS